MASSSDNIADLVGRIENLTQEFETIHQRLNDMPGALEDARDDDDGTPPPPPPEEDYDDEDKLGALAARLDRVAVEAEQLETSLSKPVPSVAFVALKAEVEGTSTGLGLNEFEKTVMKTSMLQYLEAAAGLGERVAEQAVSVGKAFQLQADMLRYVKAERPMPDNETLRSWLEETSAALEAVDAFAKDCSLDERDLTALVAGGVHALGWVAMPDDPALHISETLKALPTYGQRIQGRGPEYKAFYDSFRNMLRSLQDYVKAEHARGLCNYPSLAPADSMVSGGSSVAAFDDLLARCLPSLETAASEIGSPVSEQVQAICDAFRAQREMLLAASECRPPPEEDLIIVLRDTSDALQRVGQHLAERDHPLFNHTSFLAGGCDGLNWITIHMNPSNVVGDVLQGMTVFAQKIFKDHSEEPAHTSLVTSFRDLLQGLKAYVTEQHPMGLVWNVDGVDYMEYRARTGV